MAASSALSSGREPKCCATYAREPRRPSSSPLQRAMRIVRRGAMPIALRMRTASIVAAAADDDGERLLLGQELDAVEEELTALDRLLAPEARAAAAGRIAAGDLVEPELLQRRVVVTLELRLLVRLELARIAEHHDLAGELSLVLLEVGGGLDLRLYRFAADRAVRAGRPRQRERGELGDVGRDEADER